MQPIITSLLDNDLYKFTMQQVFYYYDNNMRVKYSFTCRTPDIDFSGLLDEINAQVDHLCTLKFTEDELLYLGKFPYIKNCFIRYLRGFQLDRKDIVINCRDKKLTVDIEGPVVNTTLFEIPVLAIISEIYSTKKGVLPKEAIEVGEQRLKIKLEKLKGLDKPLIFTDFGTRRRYCKQWHEHVITELKNSGYKHFAGTSNVDIARRFNLLPVGTMAHEWICFHAGITRLDKSNHLALSRWLDFYKGELGTALTDTYTTDHFLSDFDAQFARGFTGVRHDSGDWKEWGYKMINHYKKLGVAPESKLLLFSDSLNLDRMIEINDEFYNKAKVGFGIGTNLTNDVGYKPLQIVIKMMHCDGFPLIKISDSPGKIMCEDEDLKRFALNYFLYQGK